jgi:hypothetical protein
MSDLRQFYGALFQPGDGLIEFRALPSKHCEFISPGDMAQVRRFIENHRAENVYFAVAARKDKTSGRLKNCSVIRCLFADLDFKLFESEAKAWQSLEGFPLKPSITVHSGGGLHCYWLLAEPMDLQARAAECKKLLRSIARAIGADLSSAEPAHILRVPQSFNYKYDPPREIHLV